MSKPAVKLPPGGPSPGPPPPGADRRRRLGRLAMVLFTFLGLGPPVALIVYMFLMATLLTNSAAEIIGIVITTLAAITMIPTGYIVGGIPAAVLGLVVGIRQAWFGPTPMWLALALGVLTGVVFTWVTDGLGGIAPGGSTQVPTVLVIASVAATMLCWWLIRNEHDPVTRPETEQ